MINQKHGKKQACVMEIRKGGDVHGETDVRPPGQDLTRLSWYMM